MTKKVILSENALKVAQSRYFMDENEDWEKMSYRVSSVVAGPETKDRNKIQEQFQEMIYEMSFLPAGRTLRNAGRQKGSMLNCFHLDIGDSMEEIGECLKNCGILWTSGGGVGLSVSEIRPENDKILGKGGFASGPVSFLTAYNAYAKTVESGGNRRAAALAHIDISHPDLLKFIDAKLVHGKLDCFNISVAINNEFLEAVERDLDWTFKFNQRNYNTVKARDIWNKIIDNMVESAEPGLINWSNFSKNNSYYFNPVTGTNPCGETCLANGESCDLGSIVLPNFITGSINTNWKKLEQTIRLAIRFLDNVLDINKYDLKLIDINSSNSRRLGLGVLGVADYLFAKKIRYGSKKAIFELERLMRFIRDISYQASIELAIEKGSFPKFDPIAYCKASFIRKLSAPLRMDIKKYGIRNTTLMALAPTGTISLLTNYSNGIEPLFSKAYLRQDRVGDRVYIHPMYKEFMQNSQEIPDWYVDTFDLTPGDHFEVQCVMQKYVDGSVSKTINLPNNTTSDELSKLLLEYVYDLKGVTVYRDGCRDGQILNRISEEEVKKYMNENKIDSFLEACDVKCSTGSCEL